MGYLARMKTYLTNWTDDGMRRTFWVAHVPDYALHCGSDRTLAEKHCRNLNRAKVEVQLMNGQKHICEDFRVEDIQFKGLVVYCDVPSPIRALPA
jgi:hypothetical protein